MSLFEQFQTIIGSIVFGSLSLFTWTLFNRIFYSKKLYIIRFPLEIILFCYIAYIYYRFYAYYFESLFEEVASSLYKKIILPIKLKIKKICGKLFLRKKKKKYEIKQNNQ